MKGFAPPYRLPEPSFLTEHILSLGLQIFLLINYYASCQISIAITKRLIATMRCGTPLLQGNFLLFLLWHNIGERSGRTGKHKFSQSPSAEEVILITAEGWQLAPAAAPQRALQPSVKVAFNPGCISANANRYPSHFADNKIDPDVYVFLFTKCRGGINNNNLHVKPFYFRP